MSQEDDEEPGTTKKALRTVTSSYLGREDREMDAIGWMILAGLMMVMLPLLPILALVWVFTKLLHWIDPQTE